MKANEIKKIEYLGMRRKENYPVSEGRKNLFVSIPFGSYSKKTLSERVVEEMEKNAGNAGNVVYCLSENCVTVNLTVAIALLNTKTIAKKVGKDGNNFENIFKIEVSTDDVDSTEEINLNKKESIDRLLKRASQGKVMDVYNVGDVEEVNVYLNDPDNEIKIDEVIYHGFAKKENFQDCGEDGDIDIFLDPGEYTVTSLKEAIQDKMMYTEYAPNWSEWEKFNQWDDIEFILKSLKQGDKKEDYSHVFVVWLDNWEF